MHINNPEITARSFKKRIIAISICMLICSLIIIARLVYLQIYQNDHYLTLSSNNRLRIELIQPHRGIIYDRNHKVLANNIEQDSLFIKKNAHKNSLKTIIKILNTDPITSSKWLKKYKQARYNSYIRLMNNLNESTKAKIYVNQFRLPDIKIVKSFKRSYPYDFLSATALGLAIKPTPDNKLYPISKKDNMNLIKDGLSGVEKYHNNLLSGAYGHKEVEVNAHGQILRTTNYYDAKNGSDITLTIDINLQKILYSAFGNNSGAAVAINPNNGEILAIASFPSYSPNSFNSKSIGKKLIKWQKNPEKPLFNRALLGLFPPASTIKPLIGLISLEKNIITPKTEIYDPGSYTIGNHTYRDHHKHGWVNLEKAIAVSCDTYFYDLSTKLGIENIVNILSDFGLGSQVASDLNNKIGIVNSPQWKRDNQHQPWYIGDTIISSIGQGNMLATPLQIANMTALLAKRGHGFQPHIIKSIDNEETPIQAWDIKTITNPMNYSIIIRAMQKVIHSKYAGHTGWRFGNSSYSIAAKTGTAELFHQNNRNNKNIPRRLQDHAWFIGFAPVEKPQIALAVIVEHSPSAVTIAKTILDRFFNEII